MKDLRYFLLGLIDCFEERIFGFGWLFWLGISSKEPK
jgi:hypothetical protein